MQISEGNLCIKVLLNLCELHFALVHFQVKIVALHVCQTVGTVASAAAGLGHHIKSSFSTAASNHFLVALLCLIICYQLVTAHL